MRRWLRVLLVGALTVVLSIDSASACRFLRPRCRPRHVPVCGPITTCPPRVAATCRAADCCVPADGSAHAVITEVCPVETVHSHAFDHGPACCMSEGIVDDDALPQAWTDSVTAETILAPGDVAADAATSLPLGSVGDTVAPAHAPVEEAADPRAAAAPSEPSVTERAVEEPRMPPEPIAPASAEEPMPPSETARGSDAVDDAKAALEDMPAEAEGGQPPARKPETKPAPLEEQPPETEKKTEKKENLFDEDEDEDEPGEPAVDSGTGDEPAPLAEPPAEEEPLPQDAPKEPGEEPAEEADPFSLLLPTPNEPVRRWIDDTGTHETIGRLVEVGDRSVRILKANGRFSTVPLARLSLHDRGYVARTEARLAAERRERAPAVTDTAGM